MTSGDLITLYDEWCLAGGMAPGSRRLRTHFLNRFAAHYDLATCTPEHLAAWLASHDTWKPATKASARSALTTFFSWAHKHAHRPDDPSADLKPIRVPLPPPKPVPENVLKDALKNATPRQRLALLLGAFAGLRRAEIAGLHADHIELDTGQLRVTGKGSKTRLVPAHPILMPYLEEAKAAGGYLFPNGHGYHVTPTTIGRLVKPLLGNLSTHALRHRFATQVHAASHDLRAVQDLLGHSSLATTQRYLQVTDEQKLAAIRSLGGAA